MIENINIHRITKKYISILFCTLMIYACSDDNSKDVNYFSELNGFWIGTATTREIGDCSFYGDYIVNVLLEIKINDTGVVDIVEYFYVDSLNTYYYIDSIKYHWTGTINREYDFDFQKPGFANCFGVPREYFTLYEGAILNENDNYILKTDSDEEWCPLENCIFNIEYELRHIDSLVTNIKKYDESDDEWTEINNAK